MRPLTKATAQLLSPIALSTRDRLSLSLDKDGERFVADIYQRDAYDDTRRTYASYNASKTFPLRVAERKRLTGDSWEFAATDFTVSVIDSLWPRDQIEFTPEARLVYEYLLSTCASQETNAETYARYKENGELPAHGCELHPDRPLSKYQQVALHNSMSSEGYALFMEQGTGKTPVVIARVCNESRNVEGRMYRALIVAPKNVRLNWQSEFFKFATEAGKVTVLRGGQLERTKLLIDAFTQEDDCRYTVVIVSYETMCVAWDLLKMVEWDLAVLDEAHYIKSPQTRRFKFAMKLRELAQNRMILTGTPVTNTPLDLYAQFEFLGRGWSGFRTWENFRSFYGVYDRTESGFNKLVAMQNLPFMQERLARVSFIIRKQDALPDLPEKVYDVYEVEMTNEQREVYDKVATQLALEIEDELNREDNKQLVISNVLTKLLRLAQITSGFVTWDPVVTDDGEIIKPRRIEFMAVNPKVDALREILAEKGPDDKTIVWACFVPDIKAIKAMCDAAGIKAVTYYGGTSEKDRAEAERAFNCDPDCKVFIGNPAAGGTGLNLLGYPPGDGTDYTTNANHVVYYSQNWSSTARSQSEDRAHRRGTRTNVRVTDLCVPDTIDEEIRARVLEKQRVAYEVSDIREILRSVLRGVNI